MAETIKPCPFCNGEAKLHTMNNKTKFYVQCDNMDCKCDVSTLTYDSKKDAIEAWNNRAYV